MTTPDLTAAPASRRAPRLRAFASAAASQPVPMIAAVLSGLFWLTVSNFDLSDALQPSAVYAAAGFMIGAVAGQRAFGAVGAALAAVLAATVLYFYDPLMVEHGLFLAGLCAAVGAIPLVRIGAQGPGAWDSLAVDGTAVLVAGATGGILVAGLAILQAAFENLFAVETGERLWQVAVPIIFAWLAPTLFIVLARADGPAARVAGALSMLAQAFARWVGIPLTTIFAVLLYAYIARIAAQGALPSGEVGWIVPTFALCGAAIFVVLAGETSPGTASRRFRALWFALSVPPVVLLIIAVHARLSAYGVTSSRYMLALLTLWLTAIAVFYIVGMGRRSMRWVPITVAAALVLGAVGPWSLRPVVVWSQTGIVRAALADAPLDQADPVRFRQLCSHVYAAEGVAGGKDAVRARLADPTAVDACWKSVEFAGPRSVTLEYYGPIEITEAGLVYPSQSLVRDVGSDGSRLTVDLTENELQIAADGWAESFALPALIAALEAREAGTALTIRGERITVWFQRVTYVKEPDGAVSLSAATGTVVDHGTSPPEPVRAE